MAKSSMINTDNEKEFNYVATKESAKRTNQDTPSINKMDTAQSEYDSLDPLNKAELNFQKYLDEIDEDALDNYFTELFVAIFGEE